MPEFLEAVWQRVATLAAFDLGFEINEDLFAVEWIAPAQPWVDPAKDVDATISQINAGLMSRRQAVATLGYSIEQPDSEIAADRIREACLLASKGQDKQEANHEHKAYSEPRQSVSHHTELAPAA